MTGFKRIEGTVNKELTTKPNKFEPEKDYQNIAIHY